jgi:hypothetical protein
MLTTLASQPQTASFFYGLVLELRAYTLSHSASPFL